MSVERPDMPTFSSLNLDSKPSSPPIPTSNHPLDPMLGRLRHQGWPLWSLQQMLLYLHWACMHGGCTCDPEDNQSNPHNVDSNLDLILENFQSDYFLFCAHLYSIFQCLMFCFWEIDTDLHIWNEKKAFNHLILRHHCEAPVEHEKHLYYLTSRSLFYIYYISFYICCCYCRTENSGAGKGGQNFSHIWTHSYKGSG